ncbi:MAG: ABC transporter permease [bacterium]
MNKFKKLSIPYIIWMGILILIPLALMLLLSVLSINYFEFDSASFSLAHLNTVFSKANLDATLLSTKLALLATIGSLIIGYPVAYIVSNLKTKYKFFILLLFIVPMWTNLLLRVETINRLLQPAGLLNNMFGISIDLSGTQTAVILTMILIYIPFMIFPIYTVLEKTDKGLIEAANDLGAGPIKTFLKVTLPLSAKGITSGVTMVFLPCAMGFTIPYIVSNGNMQLIGNIIERYFKDGTGQFNIGSSISLLLMIVVFAALFLMMKIDEEGEMLI